MIQQRLENIFTTILNRINQEENLDDMEIEYKGIDYPKSVDIADSGGFKELLLRIIEVTVDGIKIEFHVDNCFAIITTPTGSSPYYLNDESNELLISILDKRTREELLTLEDKFKIVFDEKRKKKFEEKKRKEDYPTRKDAYKIEVKGRETEESIGKAVPAGLRSFRNPNPVPVAPFRDYKWQSISSPGPSYANKWNDSVPTPTEEPTLNTAHTGTTANGPSGLGVETIAEILNSPTTNLTHQ